MNRSFCNGNWHEKWVSVLIVWGLFHDMIGRSPIGVGKWLDEKTVWHILVIVWIFSYMTRWKLTCTLNIYWQILTQTRVNCKCNRNICPGRKKWSENGHVWLYMGIHWLMNEEIHLNVWAIKINVNCVNWPLVHWIDESCLHKLGTYSVSYTCGSF